MGISKIYNLKTWEEFEVFAQDKFREKGVKQETDIGGQTSPASVWIYRGQANAEWSLATTLSRYLEDIETSEYNFRLKCHYGLIRGAIPAINSLTSYNFEEFKIEDLKLDQNNCPDHYELLSFVRHLGFPSPLLDWTYSIYVAAFFAFKDAGPEDNVAIYGFQTCNKNYQEATNTDNWINHCGPYVRSHHRHYRQRGTYTLCTTEKGGNVLLGSYEDAFHENREKHDIKKIIIPGSEKEKVLLRLFSMNINDYTLFGDEESLMRMLAYKEFRKIT